MSTKNNPHDPVRTRDHVRTPSKPFDASGGFIEAVRPFHRIVYMVAFAGTKSRVAAERIAVEAFSAAFRLWKCEGPEPEELESCLIRIALSEARKYADGKVREDIREDIGDLVISQTFGGTATISKQYHSG
jgi:DNA-directed RNA polymerase specialized sigma24 family protein